MRKNDDINIQFGPNTIGIIMSIFLVFMGIICFAGYVIMVTEASGNILMMSIGILGFPPAIFMIFDGFSYMFLRILINHDSITIKRFLRKTVSIDKSEVTHFTHLIALDSGRRGDVLLVTIFTKDKSYKIKYSRGLVQNEITMLKSLKELGNGEKHISKPTIKEQFYF